MFGFGIQELLVILAIVLLIFGPKRLKNIGADLGNAIRGFRTAVAEEEKPSEHKAASAAKVIDGEGAAASATNQSQPVNEQDKSP